MSASAILSGWLYVPLTVVSGPGELVALKQQLTFLSPYAIGEDVVDEQGRIIATLPPEPIPLYTENRAGYIGVPRAWGLGTFSDLDVIDRTSLGVPVSVRKRPSPNHSSVRDPIAQAAFMESLRTGMDTYHTFTAKASTGCHAKGTLILLYNGSRRPVEHIRVGDQLMGPDSQPRSVTGLARGQQEMFRITPTKGESFTVNRDHLLNLRRTRSFHGDVSFHVNGSRNQLQRAGELVNVTVGDWLGWSASRKHLYKLRRVGVEFAPGCTDLPIPPYILGLWLGDGSSRVTALTCADAELATEWERYAKSIGCYFRKEYMPDNAASTYYIVGYPNGRTHQNPFLAALQNLNLIQNKHIPLCYLTASKTERLALLAGLLDTDGYRDKSGVAEIVQKRLKLMEHIVFLARSLGFAAYTTPKQVGGATYYRTCISGDLSDVPTKLARKKFTPRQQKKNVCVTGFTAQSVGDGDYYGFSLDGDHLYLTGDFTVHHNTGKTVSALDTAAHLGRRFLVLVHLERLMHQWVREGIDKLGLLPSEIGIVQQDRCEWEDKVMSVGLLPSIAHRVYPPGFYSAFGLVITDEVHKVGTRHYAPVAPLFSAKYRLQLSATTNRRDGGEKIYYYHSGPVRVVSQAPALPMRVIVLNYFSRMPLWGKTRGSRINCLTKDRSRNSMLARVIHGFYIKGRRALIVSESVLHLQHLMGLAASLGVPTDMMGQFTSERQTVEVTTGADGKPCRTIKKTKIKADELERVKQNSTLVFATYGMITEGIDQPAWDMGLDATPRSQGEQLIGRVRRTMPGKRTPQWVTIRDRMCPMSERWFKSRCWDYHATGAEVVYYESQERNFDG